MNIKKPEQAATASCVEALQALLALSGVAVTPDEAQSVLRALTRLAPPTHGR
ncbi:MAG: hypothetical protein ACTHJ1_12975 [Bordetella sp.]|uniref:hypothetical protein n=1 Tax=Bordetella sp. TaxID=28081 RepID=UPI003F7C13DA